MHCLEGQVGTTSCCGSGCVRVPACFLPFCSLHQINITNIPFQLLYYLTSPCLVVFSPTITQTFVSIIILLNASMNTLNMTCIHMLCALFGLQALLGSQV